MTAFRKAQAASKLVRVRDAALDWIVQETMKTISDIVGATLGPGGAPVLIERQQFSLPPLVTKDGVTVFSSLGFDNPIAQSIMESARDAAIRTVSEAGDGTTTATVLAYALVTQAQAFHKKHPEVPPQRIVQTVQRVFEQVIEPAVVEWATKVKVHTPEGRALCLSVATISANGETKLAEAVMNCFDIIGDKGNVSLSEKSGPSGYQVEKVEGFPISTGYEDSSGKWMSTFLNDQGNNRVHLEEPVVILYNGTLTDIGMALPMLNILQDAYNNGKVNQRIDAMPSLAHPGVVLVAHGFSDAFLGSLHLNWTKGSLKVYPVITPRSALINGEVHFLEDLAAVTGADIFNPVSNPFDSAEAMVVGPDGNTYHLPFAGHAKEFEALRFRSTVIGVNNEDDVVARADTLEKMAKTAISELDSRLIEERRAALTGGIAKLFVVGSSTGDIKERKDRADDAVRAVQGALKAGVLPGGGWTLLKLTQLLEEKFTTEDAKPEEASVVDEVIIPALRLPFIKLLTNTGIDEKAAKEIGQKVGMNGNLVFDAANQKVVDAFTAGILDSTPAVLEAIRNSISIATLLGTLGGVVVFPRDADMERAEAASSRDFERNSSVEIANEHW